ncbi:MAG: hypothetical protein RRY36_09495 [Bacteroidaceae bacterium]
MKREWKEEDFKIAKKAIRKFLKSRKFNANPLNINDIFRKAKTFNHLDEICGFTYTSSGSYAGYFIPNIELYLDYEKRFYIYGFCMDNDRTMYAHSMNFNDDDDIYLPIS